MAAELVFAPEVEGDLADAYRWYEGQRTGLGEDFLDRVDACLRSICRLPEAHAVVHPNVRRALVRRFPFAIFHEFAGETVTVYGVTHTSPDPERWRRRLP